MTIPESDHEWEDNASDGGFKKQYAKQSAKQAPPVRRSRGRPKTKKTPAPLHASDSSYATSDEHLDTRSADSFSPEDFDYTSEADPTYNDSKKWKKYESEVNKDFLSRRLRVALTDEDAWKIITKLENEIASLRRRLHQALESKKKVTELKTRAREKLDTKNLDSKNLQSKKKDLREQLADAKAEIAALNEKLGIQEQVIRQWHDETIEKDTRDFAFDTDEVIVGELKALFDGTKKWIQKYGVRDWDRIAKKSRPAILKVLQDKALPMAASESGIDAVHKNNIPPTVVATAILNRAFVTATLASPFEILAADKALSGKTGSATTLRGVYRALSSGE
jgi:hypothetical protein